MHTLHGSELLSLPIWTELMLLLLLWADEESELEYAQAALWALMRPPRGHCEGSMKPAGPAVGLRRTRKQTGPRSRATGVTHGRTNAPANWPDGGATKSLEISLSLFPR